MIEQTLVLIKPDGVLRAIVGEIITRFERVGLKIVGIKMVYPNEKLADEHYIADEKWLLNVGDRQIKKYAEKGITLDKTSRQIGEEVRARLMNYLVMSPIIALVLEGNNAVKNVRKMVGNMSPEDCPPGTIRGDYSFDTFQSSDDSDRSIYNLIHASGEVDEAKREIKIWFNAEEIHTWKRIDEDLLYGAMK